MGVDGSLTGWRAVVGRSIGVLGAGAAAFLASMQVLPTYDEAWWIAVSRRVRLGNELYIGAIDNKPPGLHALVWVLDILPVDYRTARAALVAFLALVMVWALLRLRLGRPVAISTTVAVGTLNGGALTVEFVVGVFVLCALVFLESHTALSVALLVGSVLFDLRAAIVAGALFAVLVVWGSEGARRAGVVGSVLLALWTGIVLANDALRFGLLEIAVASRRVGPQANAWRSLGLALIIACVGVLLTGEASSPRVDRIGLVIVATGAATAAVSLLPTPRYWTYALLGVVVAVRGVGLRLAPIIRGSAALVCVGVVVIAQGAARESADVIWERYRAVSARVAPADVVVSFDRYPHLAALDPEAFALAGPVAWYLSVETSRQDQLIADAEQALQEADMIVVDRELLGPGPYWIGYAVPLALMQSYADEFEPVYDDGAVVILERTP